jgi:hypothetical protein
MEGIGTIDLQAGMEPSISTQLIGPQLISHTHNPDIWQEEKVL